jgi:hypothetical protein
LIEEEDATGAIDERAIVFGADISSLATAWLALAAAMGSPIECDLASLRSPFPWVVVCTSGMVAGMIVDVTTGVANELPAEAATLPGAEFLDCALWVRGTLHLLAAAETFPDTLPAVFAVSSETGADAVAEPCAAANFAANPPTAEAPAS